MKSYTTGIIYVQIVNVFNFRNRIRMYPAFVNCTTIDWFSEWPQDALLEVADKYLENMEFASEEEVNYKIVHRTLVPLDQCSY